MHPFTDSKGRPWQLEVNCETIEQVKAQCGVNILDIAVFDSDVAREIALFPPLLCKLLFSALAEQAKTKEVDDREFRRSMNGDAINAAHEALLDEIVLFSPKHRHQLLQAVRDKNREVEEAGLALALEKLNDPAMKSRALEAMERQTRRQIEEALKALEPLTPENRSATGSSTSAGRPPDSSTGPVPALTPGDGSSGSPTEPTGPLPA